MILGFLFVMALIGAGSFGWGRAILVASDRLGWNNVWEEVSPPLATVLGMGLFLAVFGVLLAFHLVLVGLLVGWHVIGVIMLVLFRGRTTTINRPLRRWSLSWPWWRYGCFAAVLAMLSLCALSFPIANVTYNPNDDDAAYLYLAKRMLATGAAIDPFNQRRLVSLGGSTLYQAFILRFAGDSSLQTFEFVFCLLLLWLLVIRTFKRRWLVLFSFIIGACLVFVHGIGPISNSSPSFSGVLFSLATFQMLVLVRRDSLVRERVLFGLLGLVYGAALTLRIYFAVALGIVIVLTLLWRRREIMSWKNLLILPATSLVVLIGWSVSSYESTRAWLFPLFSGNYISTFPGSTDPSVHLSSLFHRFAHVLSYDGVASVLAIVFVLGVIYLVRGNMQRPVGDVAMLAAIAAVVQLGIFAWLQSGAPFDDMWRFEAPTCLAVAMFSVDAVWPMVPVGSSLRFTGVWSRVRRVNTVAGFPGFLISRLRRANPAVGFRVIAVLGVLWATFGAQDPSFYWTMLRGNINSGTQVLTGSVGLQEHYSQTLRDEYNEINHVIPGHSQVFSAVDDPYLLEMSRFNFATLDIVGSVSPPPGMPLTSPVALVRYLQRLGYQYIVFSSPVELGLYNLESWKLDQTSPVYEYRQWASYFVRWDRLVERVAHNKNYPTTQVGDLSLISLDRPTGVASDKQHVP